MTSTSTAITSGVLHDCGTRWPRSTKIGSGLAVDPMTQVTVTCGATEAMGSALLGIINPATKSVIFEPFLTRTTPPTRSCATPNRCSCRCPPPDRSTWTVWPKPSLSGRARSLCARRTIRLAACSAAPSSRRSRRSASSMNAFAVTDEIYEHIYYEGEHIPMATLPGMAVPHDHDQRRVQDVQRHGMAHRDDHFAARRHRRDPESPRLPDRRCARPRCRKRSPVGMETLGDDYYEQLKREPYRPAPRHSLCRADPSRLQMPSRRRARTT